MHRLANGHISQPRTTFLGGKHQMNVNCGEGLWHKAADFATTSSRLEFISPCSQGRRSRNRANLGLCCRTSSRFKDCFAPIPPTSGAGVREIHVSPVTYPALRPSIIMTAAVLI